MKEEINYWEEINKLLEDNGEDKIPNGTLDWQAAVIYKLMKIVLRNK